ncbi:hypothetical protein ACQP2U_42495 (plasmid) [Nocardia sp. CA-084685]|uniref:hypothetical protein n=1 Tax=Nocardia sp. CA-084685 TaxID=3239970 RepID=UPI003D9735E1
MGTLRTVGDLYDAATIADLSAVHDPPIPESLTDAVAYFDVLVSRLKPSELFTAVQQFGLSQRLAVLACRLTTPREGAGMYQPLSETVDSISDRHAWADATLTMLTTVGPDQWRQRELGVLRMALRLHLALLGEGFLRVSEWATSPLRWKETSPGVNVAVCPVAGAPRPLEARVSLYEGDRRVVDSETELFSPHRTAPVLLYQWQVGWRDDTGTFLPYTGKLERSIAAARFAVEATVPELADAVDTLRATSTGELFVPHASGAAIRIGLWDILMATMCEHRGSDADQELLWPMSPHSLPDEAAASVVAVLFDQLSLPWPRVGDPACDTAVNSGEFAEFLSRQAVELTDLVRNYLIGMSEAGPGDRNLGDRHATGFRAAMLNDADAAAVASELPAPTFGYSLMTNVEMLAPYFDEYPDGPTI